MFSTNVFGLIAMTQLLVNRRCPAPQPASPILTRRARLQGRRPPRRPRPPLRRPPHLLPQRPPQETCPQPPPAVQHLEHHFPLSLPPRSSRWSCRPRYVLLSLSRSQHSHPSPVNIGLVSGAGYAFYTRPYLRRDTSAIASAVAAAFALAATESYVAEQYRKTPAGQREEQLANEHGSAMYRQAREYILAPGVLSTLVGVRE